MIRTMWGAGSVRLGLSLKVGKEVDGLLRVMADTRIHTRRIYL